MWWNFVARDHDEIVGARQDWEAGRGSGDVDHPAGAAGRARAADDAAQGAREPAPLADCSP